MKTLIILIALIVLGCAVTLIVVGTIWLVKFMLEDL